MGVVDPKSADMPMNDWLLRNRDQSFQMRYVVILFVIRLRSKKKFAPEKDFSG